MKPSIQPEAKSQTLGRWGRLAWLPLPLLVVAIAGLWVADLRIVWPLRPLNWIFHFGSVALGITLIVIPAARRFLASRQPTVLMLGTGVLVMQIGVAVMPTRSLDIGFAIYNTSVLLAALCHFTGMAITSRRKIRFKRTATWLMAAYGGGMAAMGLVIWGALTDRMPVFFIDGQGGTLLRTLLVSAAVVLFVLTAGLLWQANRRAASPFLYWYALSLILLATGLTGSLLIAVRDAPLQWATRSTQFLGLVYMCVAVLISARGSDSKGFPLAAVEEAWREKVFLPSLRQQTLLREGVRYGTAVVTVTAAMGMRLVLTAWVGLGLPVYITFYPAVMLVALLAGFGPGLVATMLVGLTTAYWILPPDGFAITSPVDRLGLLIFSGMGLFMSTVAGLYRRNRDKSAAYDRDAALHESRARLAAFAEATFEGIVESEAGRIVDCNEQLARMLGYSVAELKGVEIARLIAPEDLDWVIANIRQDRESLIEHAMLRKDGTHIVVEAHGRLVSPGNAIRHTAIRDITERNRAEEALRKAHGGLELLIQERTRELEEANESLEQRIVERTTDLQTANTKLLDSRRAALNMMEDAVAARRQAEEASAELRNSEARYRSLFETMSEGFSIDEIICDENGKPCDFRYLELNPAFERQTGLKAADIVGRTVLELFPDTEPLWIERYGKVALTGEPAHFEAWFGPLEKCFEVSVYQTEPGRFAVVFFDITERKRAEEALRQSEERYRMLFDTLIEGFCIIEVLFDAANRPIDYRFLEINPAFEAQTGLHNAQGKRMRELAPEHEAHWFEMYGKVALTGKSVRFVNEAKALNRWFDVSAYRVDGGDSRTVAILFNDITEAKQAEVALQKAHYELELRVMERTEELAATVDTLMGEIAERKRAEGNLQRLNRLYAVLSETDQAIVRASDRDSMFRDFCRIAVEDGGFILSWVGLVDKEGGQLKLVAAHGATAYLDDIRISVNKEPTGLGPTGISVREGTYYICNDFQNDPITRPWHERGRAHGIAASASIALKQEGRVIGALTLYAREKDFFDRQHEELLLQMGADISFALDNLERENRRREAELALQKETAERLRAVEDLREKERLLIQQSRQAAMGEMIGNIAHQWRQPLNTLGLLTQELSLSHELGEFSKEHLDASVEKIMRIIIHMSQTIDDFRNFYKPDRERIQFRVNQVVIKTVSLIEASFKEQQIGIAVDAEGDPSIAGYPNEYAQVLLNILLNARDAFLEQKVASPRVVVRLFVENGKAVVTVTDNAGGIADNIIGKIFDPYFTTKAPDKGTGIGLFMSKNIIEKNMHGTLSARNTGAGAEFRIEV